MNFSRIFIMRPIATALAMLALALAGLLAWRELPVAALPQVDFPVIQVTTLYPGAGPEVIAALVSAPLERQLGQMPGLAQMLSTSSGGASSITLRFDLGLALDSAEQEVQAAINAAANLLPADLPAPPIYRKINPADAPVMTLAVSSQTIPLYQVRDLLELRVVQRLAQISGVGLVSVAGGQRPALRIEADMLALASHGLSMADVRRAVNQASVNQPKGNLDGPQRSLSISMNDQLHDPDEYARLIIAYENGAALRLGDLAHISRAPEDRDQAAWFNGAPALLLNIQRQPGANVIELAERITALLPQLRQSLPAGIDVQLAADRTHTIRDSVRHVQLEMLLAIALVVAVTYAFLRSWRVTLIPAVVVPLSLVGSFAIMFLLGFSINNLSLMALTIATGFVVDDAIVMVENIARHIEEGARPLQAALRGARQIGFTLVSLTLSLIAVLIPLLFMADVLGRLFREFAISLAVAIFLSLLISLSLTPMMCARMLRAQADSPPEGRWQAWLQRPLDALAGAYARALRWVLGHQGAVLWAALASVLVTALLYVGIPKGFFPQQDTGIIQAQLQGPQSASLRAMSRLQHAALDLILADPAVDSASVFIGVDGENSTLNTARAQISLRALESRQASAAEVIARLQPRLNSIPGLQAWLQPQQELTIDDQASRASLLLSLSAPDGALLEQHVPRLVAAMQDLPELRNVSADLQPNGLRLQVAVDREAAARLGVSIAAIDEALYDAFGQRLISTIYTQSAQYRVVLEASAALREAGPRALEQIYVAGSDASLVPLSALARAQSARGPLTELRLDQFPAVNISFDLAEGAALSAAVAAIEGLRAELALPAALELKFQGQARAFQASLVSTLWLLAAAVLTMYIVLGVLYESLVHPITILSTLPSAAIGALAALWLAGFALDMIGVIGVILLIGIVKKNAILMIDFALVAQREQRLAPAEAIYQAALLRFRPILMTTMAAFFSALPLMFASGSGAELRQPLGYAMVGGLALSQLLTLFTTPVIYLLFERLGQKRRAPA